MSAPTSATPRLAERVLARLRRAPLGLRSGVLALGAAAVALAVFARPPVLQDPGYFGHADQRTLLGVPNALNVLSNLPFVLPAWLGLRRARSLPRGQRAAAVVAFLAIGAVTLGSSYYHLDPGSVGLLVDRLPISLAFAALFAWVLGDRLGPRWASVTLVPLLALSLLTLWIWYGGGELDGDLRPYGLVQAVPLGCLPFLILLFPGAFDDRRLALTLALYLVAKACEVLDAQIFALGELVSGHTLKHLFAAGACMGLVPPAPEEAGTGALAGTAGPSPRR
jgi:hypothetical protein